MNARLEHEPENIDISMFRPNLVDLPDLALPPGYSLRLYREGDGPLWEEIVRASERFLEIRPGRFEEEFDDHMDKLDDRMRFLVDPDGWEVGTATAWFHPDPDLGGQITGLVHWVAIRPESQGRGLSKPMLSVVLKRLAQEHERAILNTSSGRTVALKIYLDLGFLPNLNRDRAVEAWSQVRRVLDHPTLRAMPELTT